MPPIKISTVAGVITKKFTNNNRCLRCSATLAEHDEYQLIFDETGQEMNIKNLLKECFEIQIDQDIEKFQALCEDCLNELIETFDILELKRSQLNSDCFQTNLNNTIELSPTAAASSNNIDDDDMNDDNEKSEELNEIKDNDEYIFDNNDYIMKTEEEFQTELESSKEVLLDEQESKTMDYIIEDICDEDGEEILAEYTIQNQEDEGLISTTDDYPVQLQLDVQENDQDELLSENYNEENCDDPDEIFNNREEYEEIDYLDDDDLTKLKDYMNKSICSNFNDITFPQAINCHLCNEALDKHSTVLKHCEAKHYNKDTSIYLCVIDENCDQFNCIEDLSNHLVYKHYDLDTLTVYSQCFICIKRFNNIIMFNKHSCYDNKNTSRSATECQLCNQTFRSNKRYRFHLQFHLDKHRPKACLICRKFFEDPNELFEHIMYEREPKDALICKFCDRNFLQLDTFENHKNVHHLKRPYGCTYCDKTYLSSQQLHDHMNAQHLQKNIYKCKVCCKEFFKRNILQKHLLNHKEPVEVSVYSCSDCGFIGKNQESVKTHIGKIHENNILVNILCNTHTVAYCCEYCEMAFNSFENLILHRKTHVDKLYECQICSAYFDTFKKVKAHRHTHKKYVDIRKLFPITRHYVCDIEGCTNNYAQWIALVSHKRSIHLIGKRKPFKCDQCNEPCANKRNLNQHIQDKHGQQSTFPCPFCPKVYTTPMAISVHIGRMHNNHKLACEHCGTLCKNKDALEKHIINTHEVLTCYICEKVLKNMKNLKTHIKMVHKKEKRYFCQYCKRGYYNNCDRLTHEEAMHIKNKVFTCDICPYVTPYRESILVHEKNHTNTKPHECNICLAKFARKYSLTLHQRRHSGVRKFVCPYKDCNSSYPNQGILNVHMRTKHSEETTILSRDKTVHVKKTKLAKILKKGIPADYLIQNDDMPDENDLNFIDEINSDSDDNYVLNSEDEDCEDSGVNNENKNVNENADNGDDNELVEDSDNIEYIFKSEFKNDDAYTVIDDEQHQSTEFIDDIEGVKIEDCETIILNENNENNYILSDNGAIEAYEIIQY